MPPFYTSAFLRLSTFSAGGRPPNLLHSQPSLVVVIKHGGSRHDDQALPFD